MKKCILLVIVVLLIMPFSISNAMENTKMNLSTSSDEWTDFQSTINDKASDESIKIIFNKELDDSTINNENIFVATDKAGLQKVDTIFEQTTNKNEIDIIDNSGNWEADTTYYLFIADNLKASDGKFLKNKIRAEFTISSIESTENTLGNIINLAELDTPYIKYGQSIYYTNSDGVYKMSSDGTGISKLVDADNASYLQLDGNWLYYIDEVVKEYSFGKSYSTSINKVKLDGSNKTKIFQTSSKSSNISFAVKDGWIYYSDKYIYKIKTDGTNNTKLLDVYGITGMLILQDDYIYYYYNKGIYQMNLDGLNNIQVVEGSKDSFNIVDGWIYYTSSTSTRGMYKVKTDGTNKTVLNSDIYSGGHIVVKEDKIYYQVTVEEALFYFVTYFYKMDIDGSNPIEIDIQDWEDEVVLDF